MHSRAPKAIVTFVTETFSTSKCTWEYNSSIIPELFYRALGITSDSASCLLLAGGYDVSHFSLRLHSQEIT